jgi:hypothetical protein
MRERERETEREGIKIKLVVCEHLRAYIPCIYPVMLGIGES